MSVNIVNRMIEFEKMKLPGIYILLNSENYTFYVGKALNSIYDRVKTHIQASHREEITNFVRQLDTGLYIFNIEDKLNNREMFDKELAFNEYCTYRYLIDKGFKSINGTSSFSQEVKERYDKENIYINLDELINYDMNLFEDGFREVILNKSYIKKITAQNQRLSSRLKYILKKNNELEIEIKDLKKIRDEKIKSMLNNYISFEEKIKKLEHENKTIKSELEEIKKFSNDLKIEYNKKIISLNEEIIDLEATIKKAKIREGDLCLKEFIKDILARVNKKLDILYKSLFKITHTRSRENEDLNLFRNTRDRYSDFVKKMKAIQNDKNIYFNMYEYKTNESIENTIRFIINLWAIFRELLIITDNSIEEDGEDRILNLCNGYSEKFEETLNNMIAYYQRWENEMKEYSITLK